MRGNSVVTSLFLSLFKALAEILVKDKVEAETAQLMQLTNEPGADIKLIYSEFQRILSLLINFNEQIHEGLKRLVHELESLKEIRRLRRQRQQLSATMKVLLIDAMVYLQWSIPLGMFSPQGNALFAFLITGLILTIITFKATAILVTIENNNPALFNVTRSPFLNRLIMHATNAVIISLLIILNYIIILYYLYLFLSISLFSF